MKASQAPTTSNSPSSPAANSKALLWSLAVLRVAGYVLLSFYFLQFIDTVVPPNLTSRAWQLETFGALVESVPVPLMAFGLIYAGREINRHPREALIIPILPWLALMLGLFYFINIPLGILNTNRLMVQTNRQKVQLEEGKTRISKIKTGLEKAKTQADIEKLLKGLGVQSGLPQLQSSQLQQVKTELGNVVQGEEDQVRAQSEQLKIARDQLIEKSVKWNVAAFLSGTFFIYVWRIMRRRA